MTEVLKKRVRSLKINELLDKTVNKISKLGLRELCGITALCYGILAFSVASALNLDIGYKIVVNDKDYGTVSSKAEAKLILDEAIRETATTKKVELQNAGFHLNVSKTSDILQKEEVKNAIVSDLEGLVFGYTIFVDGNPVVALESEKDAKNLASEILLNYKTEKNKVSFASKVEIIPTKVRSGLLKDKKGATAVMTATQEEAVVHTVEKGETFSQIALDYNISSDNLLKNNSGVIPDKLQIGQNLIITAAVPIVSVKTEEKIMVTEKVPYPVTEQKDPNMYQGIRKVLVNGVQGEKNVSYNVIKVNNIVSEKVKLSETYISQPKTEVVAVGTKVRPKEAPTGKFIRPYYGSITSRYGARWGRNHNGIDYGGTTGDPVKAADGGTVTFAGWDNGGYGYMVKINHGNGKETIYAHLNSVGVSKGQKVAQGTVIGKLGNTGRSTGPHLHFEIRINGTPVNPSGYVG